MFAKDCGVRRFRADLGKIAYAEVDVAEVERPGELEKRDLDHFDGDVRCDGPQPPQDRRKEYHLSDGRRHCGECKQRASVEKVTAGVLMSLPRSSACLTAGAAPTAAFGPCCQCPICSAGQWSPLGTNRHGV